MADPAPAADLRSGHRHSAPHHRPAPSLAEYGLDSLGNLELRTQLKAEPGIRSTATDITTIQGLPGLLCKKLAAPEAVSERVTEVSGVGYRQAVMESSIPAVLRERASLQPNDAAFTLC